MVVAEGQVEEDAVERVLRQMLLFGQQAEDAERRVVGPENAGVFGKLQFAREILVEQVVAVGDHVERFGAGQVAFDDFGLNPDRFVGEPRPFDHRTRGRGVVLVEIGVVGSFEPDGPYRQMIFVAFHSLLFPEAEDLLPLGDPAVRVAFAVDLFAESVPGPGVRPRIEGVGGVGDEHVHVRPGDIEAAVIG